MIRVILLGFTLLTANGCLRPLTDRLDRANEQLAETNEKLAVVTRKLDDTNQKLGTIERATRMFVPGLDKKE
jgi:hypothetical protein